MENLANFNWAKEINKKIELKKQSLITGNSWVNLSGNLRNEYIHLCKLQRKAIQGKLTEKEFLNVMD